MANQTEETMFQMLSGCIYQAGKARFQCPEALFQPKLLGAEGLGVHELVYNSIMKCDPSIHAELWNNVVVSGGNLFKGFQERLTKELGNLAPSGTKIKVILPPDANGAVWIGASLLASQETFKQLIVSKVEYEEVGPSIVSQKWF